MVFLHPHSLSPDPTYAGAGTATADGRAALTLFPHHLLRVHPAQNVKAWAQSLDLFRQPQPLVLRADATGRAEIVVDFGTEVDAVLELGIETSALCNLMACFGESSDEAEGWVHGARPKPADWHEHIKGAGVHFVTFKDRGFRYVRLVFHDVKESVTLRRLQAAAIFAFDNRPGDFWCDDARFQRVWQTSLYTARLCTRPDAMWDGVKRDRHGWFGDARITKETIDLAFFNPAPSEAMLPTLPTDKWTNNIPNFSFDAFAMLHGHILSFGLDRPIVEPTFERITELLDWTARTQTDENGFLILDEALSYFGDIGFVDWSKMPVGGRFEELCWLQCRYVEGLKTAAKIATWLHKTELAQTWNERAAQIGERIQKTFWRAGRGFVHTLNHVGEVENPHSAGYDGHYRRTYIEKIQLGESGPSRQSNALAIWADIADAKQREIILREVFDNAEIDPVITPYFTYWEQMARARCGDAAGGLRNLRDTIGHILESQDAACVWELFDPNITDRRRLSSHFTLNCDWPISLCHAWGSGSVGYAARYLLGVEVLQPGYGAIALRPECGFDWQVQASIPTPHGTLRFSRDKAGAPLQVQVPDGVAVESVGDGVEVVR